MSLIELLTRANIWLSEFHPAAPSLVLIVAVFTPQWVIRRWFPQLWDTPARLLFGDADLTPFKRAVFKAWQGLPSLLAGALLWSLANGGIAPTVAVIGALKAVGAPLLHELLKALPFVPYNGGQPRT